MFSNLSDETKRWLHTLWQAALAAFLVSLAAQVQDGNIDLTTVVGWKEVLVAGGAALLSKVKSMVLAKLGGT